MMARAIEEAARARGRTSPNPMVGAVLVRDDAIIATGFHPGAGEAHAEVRALEAAEVDPAGSTLYVNLEPCCHHGRTPPCTEAIIEAGIERVVVAMEDPDPRVSGEGIRRLREAGVQVEVGVMRDEAEELNRAHLTMMNRGRPYVMIKYAMTADGKIATRTGESKWITGESARRRVHEFRNEFDAILVGTGTLKADDPRLTCRIDGGRDPLRAALDADLSAPTTSRLYDVDRSDAPTVVYTARDAPDARRNELSERGIEVVVVERDQAGNLSIAEVLEDLKNRDVLSLMVEGGGGLAASLVEERYLDRIHAFIAPKIAGGREATTPVEGRGVASMADAQPLEPVEIDRFDDDCMLTFDVVEGSNDSPETASD